MKRLSYLVSLAIAVPALAQSPAGPPPQQRDSAEMRRNEAEDIALILALDAAQRPALDAFLTESAPPQPPPPRRPQMSGPGTTPPGFEQQLTQREQHASEMIDSERKRIAAARKFYTMLSAHQRRTFEALMRLRDGPGHPGGPGDRGHGPDKGPGGPDTGPDPRPE